MKPNPRSSAMTATILKPETIWLSFLSETKYKEITTLKLLLIYVFFARKDTCKES